MSEIRLINKTELERFIQRSIKAFFYDCDDWQYCASCHAALGDKHFNDCEVAPLIDQGNELLKKIGGK